MNVFSILTLCFGLIMTLILVIWFLAYIIKIWGNKKLVLKTGIRITILGALVVIPYLFMNSHIGIQLSKDFKANNFTTITFSSDDSLNFEYHYMDVMAFKRFVEIRTRHVNRPVSDFLREDWSNEIIDKFKTMKASKDSLVHDIGYLFTALHYVNLELEPRMVDGELSQLYTTNLPYFNYIKGTNDYHKRNWNSFESSEKFLLKSIEKNECVSDSYKNLSRLYFMMGEQDQLNALMDNSEISKYVPEFFKRARYLKEFNWIKYWKVRLLAEFNYWHLIGVASAIILLILWLNYMHKLDIYEPEKKRYLLLTFLISIISMQLIYPIHDVFWNVFEFYRPFNPISDLWYSVISIGMVEELVKVIPLLLMLRFTKQINEPFDYILYAAVSGLGFSFIENIGYFGESISNVSIRGIYCSIGHMAFSATIGYGLMLAKYRGYNKYLMFFMFFVLASFMHGFYDFWLIDWWAIEYKWMSDLTFVLCIYLFAFYVNNTLNNSPFFTKEVTLDRSKIIYQTLLVCVSVLMTGFVASSIYYSTQYSNYDLIRNAIRFNFYICFILLSMGSIKILRGHMSPLHLPFRNLFKTSRHLEDLSGHSLEFFTSAKFDIKKEHLENPLCLEQKVKIKERVIVNDILNSYILELERPLEIEGYETQLLLAYPQWDKGSFKSRKKTLTNLFLIEKDFDLNQPFLNEEQFTYLGKIFSTKIP